MELINGRHLLDVAQIFKEYGGHYLEGHKLCPDQLKAFRAITQCRTQALGGHLQKCSHCSYQRVAYNSCRNRHCNKCQYTKQLIWIDRLKSNLPITSYFHLVFTIPSCLHKVFYLNQRVCYNLLFKASATALQKVTQNPKFLGAQSGAVAVLHTWGQALTYHPHIHMIVPAGGLSNDGMEWIAAGKKFLAPVKAIAAVFRGVLWDLMEKQMALNNIRLPNDVASVREFKGKLYQKNWNVYAKKSMAGPQSVVQYLGKYTHRVAISNNRIFNIDQQKVTFSWKNYRNRLQKQLLTLSAQEFIDRFLRHVLPTGFYKIRYYGLLASANTGKKQLCIALINKPMPVSLLNGLCAREVVKIVAGKDPDFCPKCKNGYIRSLHPISPG